MVVFLISLWKWNSARSLIHVVREFLWIRPSCDPVSTHDGGRLSSKPLCHDPVPTASPSSHITPRHPEPPAGDRVHSRFLPLAGSWADCSCRFISAAFIPSVLVVVWERA